VFRERGDDPVFMISGTRGDVIVDIIVVGQHDNVKIDEVFSSLDLFCCIDISLHDYYLCKVLKIPLGFDVNLQIENDRKTSYILENKGLPISNNLRSDVYVKINVVYPTDLKVEDDHTLKDILETYFK
jgi:DnaJ-class molecular chaperone